MRKCAPSSAFSSRRVSAAIRAICTRTLSCLCCFETSNKHEQDLRPGVAQAAPGLYLWTSTWQYARESGTHLLPRRSRWSETSGDESYLELMRAKGYEVLFLYARGRVRDAARETTQGKISCRLRWRTSRKMSTTTATRRRRAGGEDEEEK